MPSRTATPTRVRVRRVAANIIATACEDEVFEQRISCRRGPGMYSAVRGLNWRVHVIDADRGIRLVPQRFCRKDADLAATVLSHEVGLGVDRKLVAR